jgi:DNA-binding NarL/FixJ family response regulator/signal transduction histidine kinase
VAAGLSDQLREAMKKQRPIHLESYFAPKDEWVDTYLYPSRNGLSIYIRDITERKRASQALERSASQQAAVVELGLRALASDDLQSLMDEAAAICGRMLEVELVGIHERLPGGDELVLRAGTGWSEGGLGSATSLADDASPLGHTLTSGEPLVCEDMTADGRFALSPLLAEHGATGAVCVVIEGREAPFGVLGAFATQARSFSAMDADFVQAIANVLATAVERAKFEQRLVEVREIERLRIARDLHDEALQDLSETITRAATAGSGQAEARLADVVPALQRIGRQLRGAIHDLRLAGDEDRPFPELVRGLVDVQRGLTDGCDITLTIGDGVPTGPLGRRGTEVLRIIGEAIINARRHADARHISVSVSALGRRLHAEVSDDGCGFDAQRGRAADATGIDGMGERAALLDGELHITSQAGAGTRIRIELPLTGPREPAEQVIRILLVDDHTAVREAIAAMLQREPDFDVVGQASSLAEAREMLHGVDVAVLDLGLPDGDGTELIAALRDVDPRAQALVLSAGMDRAQTARAIEGGAAATLDKTAHLHEIVDAVRRLRAGETPIALAEVLELLRFVDHQRAQERADRAAIARLTPSEREVLQALGHGLDSDAIAQRLDITSAAQRDHVASILAKLGVHSQLQAVLLAVRYGVIDVRQPGGRDGDHPDGAA